jgi:hypothetical protein
MFCALLAFLKSLSPRPRAPAFFFLPQQLPKGLSPRAPSPELDPPLENSKQHNNRQLHSAILLTKASLRSSRDRKRVFVNLGDQSSFIMKTAFSEKQNE